MERRWWERVIAAGLLLAAAAALATAARGAAGGRAAAVGRPSTARLVATVNVSELPPPPAPASEPRIVPFPVPDPGAETATRAPAEEPGGPAPANVPTITLGKQLSGAINFNQSGGWTPPDMAFAVGNGYKMEQVNEAGRVWDQNDNPGPVFSLPSFYAADGDSVFDPWMLFDAASQRWFAGGVDGATSSERLAVSTSPSPTTFKIYDVPQGDPGTFGDQAKIGVSDDVLAISSNVFGSDYLGDRITVLNKAQLVAGADTIDTAVFGPNKSYFSLVPAQSMGPTATQWYAQVVQFSIRVVRTDGTPPGSVTMSQPFAPAIKQVTQPPDAEQKGTSMLLDVVDSRIDNVVWRSNLLVATNGTGCKPRNDTAVRACARLVAVDTSTGDVTIDRNRSQNGAYLFDPAVQIDPNGTIVLGYGRSSTSLYPELDAIPADSTGRFGRKKVLVPGTAPNTTGRYGDYFAAAIDPSNTSDAWIAGEIGGGTWSTGIRQVALAP
jgi:hypothetical protein